MKFIIQRAYDASVSIDNEIVGKINHGYVVFIGVSNTDNEAIADKMISKLIGLRIFADENEKTNLSLKDVDGELLLISQFTLYADCRKGNRPSFTDAGSADHANSLYEYIIKKCREQINHVATGQFGADMKVSLTNDGPFTIILDSDTIVK